MWLFEYYFFRNYYRIIPNGITHISSYDKILVGYWTTIRFPLVILVNFIVHVELTNMLTFVKIGKNKYIVPLNNNGNILINGMISLKLYWIIYFNKVKTNKTNRFMWYLQHTKIATLNFMASLPNPFTYKEAQIVPKPVPPASVIVILDHLSQHPGFESFMCFPRSNPLPQHMVGGPFFENRATRVGEKNFQIFRI